MSNPHKRGSGAWIAFESESRTYSDIAKDLGISMVAAKARGGRWKAADG